MSYVVPESQKCYHSKHPFVIWKLIAGETVTHLPQECIDYMSPFLSLYIRYHYHHDLPTVFNFGYKYESVLEVFTERMLGIVDNATLKNECLLKELLTKVGFVGNI